LVVGLLIVGLVSAALVLYGVDRAVKARARVRRRREMSDRLAAATARAEEQLEQRQAADQASAALTSVMPAINRPPLTVPRAGRDRDSE
jgi:Flp pilus assembly protein TadB